MILWLFATAPALAGDIDDRLVTTAGVTAVVSHAVPDGDVDLLVGQRVDLAVTDSWRAALDGRVTFDPLGPPVLQWMRVSKAGFSYEMDRLHLDLGRSLVVGGGPRLVDGVQMVVDAGNNWKVGGWAGLAPDLFTTLPRVRYGGGPVAQWARGHDQASIAGEALFVPDGLDRFGALLTVRHEQGRTLDLSGRLDAQVADPSGRPTIADAALRARWDPSRTFDADLLVESYSSLRYLQSSDLDPYIKRYVTRSQELGLGYGISADLLDPSQYTLVAMGARWRGESGEDAQPMVGGSLRGRMHERPEERLIQADPRVGLVGLAGGQLDLFADALVTLTTDDTVADTGVTLTWEPAERGWAVDSSLRGVWSTAGLGWYADTFVNVFGAGRWSLVAGVFVEGNVDEPAAGAGDAAFYDLAEGGFLRASVDFAR